MKKFKIKTGDYFDEEKNDVVIEVENDSQQYNVSVAKVKNTIEFLRRKKQDLIASIDLEIEENQEILDSIKTELKKVKIKPFKRPESKNNVKFEEPAKPEIMNDLQKELGNTPQ